MDWIEIAGYIASLLVFAAFYMKTMVRLRFAAIGSNIAFAIYGYSAGLMPVFLLHAILLPLNISRLIQMLKLTREVNNAAHSDLSMEWLTPFTTKKYFNNGDTICKIGDSADRVYVILEGWVKLIEIDTEIGPGEIIGEIGIFSPQLKRTGTLVCSTDVTTITISADRIRELYYQNPQFGYHLIELIIGRLIQNQDLLVKKLSVIKKHDD